MKICREENHTNLKLSGTQSFISRGSCLHHTQEDVWVLGVLPGIPDSAPYRINDLLLTARNEKQKQENHTQLNGKKNHSEKKWVPALGATLVQVNLVSKVASYINIFI